MRPRLGKKWHEIWPKIKALGPEKVAQLLETLEENPPENEGKKVSGFGSWTYEQFIESHKIDTDDWDIASFKIGEWGMTNSEGQSFINPKAEMILKPSATAKSAKVIDLIERAVDRARQTPPTAYTFPHILKDRTQTLHYFPTDHHLGKVALNKDNVAIWDLQQASKNYLQAPQDIINQLKNPELLKEIVIGVGSDLYHYDNLKGHTTKGTALDYEGHWDLVFERGVDLNIDIINFYRQFAPVTVLEVKGNHDEQSVFAMFKALECAFHNTDGVSFQRSFQGRNYHYDGFSLVGYTHGNAIKSHDLASIMGAENENFYKARLREWRTGHIHKETVSRKKLPVFVDTDKGVTIRILKAMCKTDNWHGWHGYIQSGAGTEAFLHCDQKGLMNHLYRATEFYE